MKPAVGQQEKREIGHFLGGAHPVLRRLTFKEMFRLVIKRRIQLAAS